MLDLLRLRPHALTRALVPCLLLLPACPGQEGLLTDFDPSTTLDPSTTAETSAPATEGETTATTSTTVDTTDTTAGTETIGTLSDTAVDTAATDTDAATEGDTAATEGDTAATEGDTDTGAPACPDGDRELQASIDLFEVTGQLIPGDTAECTVETASNVDGKVTIALLCSNDDITDAPATIELGVPLDFKVDLDGLEQVHADFHYESWEPPVMWFSLHDADTGALVLAAADNYPIADKSFAPISFEAVASCGGECNKYYTYEFSHTSGPSIELFARNRGTISAEGRDYDVLLASSWENLCEEHLGSFLWIVGSSAS
ncbi:hypothetical protein [Nannocystis pusilla]|uniref:hypothetical protein n=1 Tax=Nannocystis pusilla TaxID=889268 RepID=UPI003B77DB97